MTFHRHTGTAWEEDIFHYHTGAVWTDDNDELYVHDGAVWQLIQPVSVDPPEPTDFPPPDNLATDTITDSGASFTWDNPVSSTPAPTEFQVRVLEISEVWNVLAVVEAASAGGLLPGTTYTYQVRLVHRTDGVADLFSDIVSLEFETTETTVPLGPFEDEGGSGGDSEFHPPVIGGGAFPGTPGAVDSADCWWEWKIEVWEDGAWHAMAPPQTGEYDGDTTAHLYDTSDLPSPGTYRYSVREVCNGTPGDWNDGAPFSPVNDWADRCAGAYESFDSTRAVAGYTDAVFYIPQVCPPATVEDLVTGIELTKGAGFSGLFLTEDTAEGNWQIGSVITYADSAAERAVLQGNLTAISAFMPGDFSISFRLNLSTFEGEDIEPEVLLLSLAGNAVTFLARKSGSGYTVAVQSFTTAGAIELEALSPTVLAYGDDHKLTLRWNDDGFKELFIDGTLEAANIDGDEYPSTFSDAFVAYLPADSRMWSLAGWDRLLTDNEIDEISDGEALMRTMVGYWDASKYSGSGDWLNLGTAGSAGDLVLGAATAAPAFSGTGTGAKFTFDGVNDIMETAGDVNAFEAPDVSLHDEFTIGLVYAPTAASAVNFGNYFGKPGATSSANWGFLADLTNRSVRCYVRDTSNAIFATSGAASVGVKVLIIGYLDGQSPTAHLGVKFGNGAPVTRNDSRTTTSANSSKLRLGIQKMEVAGAFIHQGGLSAGDISDILAHFGL